MSTVADKILKAPIASQMKAAQVTEFGKPLAVHTIPVPECGEDQCLVRITACGVCHTDLHVRDGDWGEGAKCPLPTTPGHEGVGIVVKIGSAVKAVQVGDRVGLPWLHTACSHCRECQQGWETTCKFQKQTGFSVNGAFAEYCVADPNFVAKIPDTLTDIQAAPILCAGVTTYKGLKESGVRPGQFIVITGAGGGLGHVAVQYAIAMGMRVIGVDGGAHKMEFLKSLGCEFTIDFMTCKDMVAEVRRLTGDYEGAHGALMLAAVPMCFTQAVHYLRPNGTVICIALPPGSFQVPHLQITLKALNVKGSIVGTRIDLLEALEIAGRGLVKCTVAERPLGDVNEVLEELHKMKVDGRVVLNLLA